ncbi:MAG: sulfur carrier protein ThiS [Firmicutes bacterium]|nr:sulfur carrier protein ThiS [Bacillota bacterium]
MITVNGREINFEKGITVADALEAAGETADAMTLVIVDGKVLPCGQLHTKPLVDGANIKLITLVSGG